MEKKIWNPGEILQLSGSYWSACTLHAAVKLDLFTSLTDQVLSAQEVAEQKNIDPRGLSMLLGALAALELLEKCGDTFTATPFAVEYLSKKSEKYLGYIILHHHHLVSGWANLDKAVASGKPVRTSSSHEHDDVARESFLMGMFNLAMQLAPQVAARVNLEGRRRLLDLGGGPGTYAIHFCQQNSRLEAVVYDLPTTRRFAEQTIARFGMGDRIAFMSGDFLSDDIKKEFDVAWLSHILHGEGPEGCEKIIRKAVSALEPGGTLLIQEFILDDSRDRPVFPALFSLNMLVGTEHGQSYSQGDLLAMLTRAGLAEVRRLNIELPNGAGIVVGRVSVG